MNWPLRSWARAWASSGVAASARETLALAFYGDLTYPEIAERTNTPLGTVKSRALLGMRRLATSSVAMDARPNMAQ